MRAFKLLRGMPGLEEGAVFVYDQHNESGLGSPALGCLILAWDNGSCQQRWCGGTFILPGQLHKDETWFREIQNPEIKASVTAIGRKAKYEITITLTTFASVS